MWAGDHNDQYPMAVSTNLGGTLEYASSGPHAFRTFRVMSNELNTPKILFCPAESDRWRTPATTFAFGGSAPPPEEMFFDSNTHLSYFVAPIADESNPARLLVGDHNLTNGTRVANYQLLVSSNRLTGWTAEMHREQGNIGIADGSVSSMSTPVLRAALTFTGVATNRLQMP